MKKLDVDALLTKLETWVGKQDAAVARLVKGKPMTDAQIDKIPLLLTQFPWPLPTPYEPKKFIIPDGYRALLQRAGGLRIEIREDDADWKPWGVFNIFTPGSCKKAHTGSGPTLCDSWTSGGTLDEREFTTTELVSFATIGFSVEASRWCFYLGGKKPPLPIYEESNDYECLAGRYVDTGKPVSKQYRPVFKSFEVWFTAVVEEITAKRKLKLGDDDKLIQRIWNHT